MMNIFKYKNPYPLDTPESTLFHRDIILHKKFLNRLYTEWYESLIRKAEHCGNGIFLEIGSGGGFLKNLFSKVVTSDILDLPLMDIVCSAEQLPFEDNSIACIMMLNVFHHIPNPCLFLNEAQRCLIMGGKILMIEPANSSWGRFIYKYFHHEPFDPNTGREINPGNPVSNSNQALPYIYFERDIKYFNEQFKKLQLNEILYHTPFLYLISGGLSRKAFLPSLLYGVVKFFERILSPFNKQLGMFCTIEIEKNNL